MPLGPAGASESRGDGPRRGAAGRKRPPRSWWREHVLARAEYLAAEADNLRVARRNLDGEGGPSGGGPVSHDPSPAASDEVLQRVQEHLGQARARADGSDQVLGRWLQRRPFDVFTGASVEGAFTRLHDAEVLLIDLLPDEEVQLRSMALERQMRESSAAADPRYAAAIEGLTASRVRPPWYRRCRARCLTENRLRRAAYRQALRAQYAVLDEQFARIRSFRNVVLLSATGMVVLVLVLAAMGARFPDELSLCFQAETASSGGSGTVSCPNGTEEPHRLDATFVMLLGLAGAGLSTAVAIRSIEGSSGPFAVPLALSVLKVASGALTALLGLLIIRGEFVPGLSRLDSQGQVLAYAVVLGYAQQLLTGFIDRQAHTVLNRVPVQLPPEAGAAGATASAGQHPGAGPVEPSTRPGKKRAGAAAQV